MSEKNRIFLEICADIAEISKKEEEKKEEEREPISDRVLDRNALKKYIGKLQDFEGIVISVNAEGRVCLGDVTLENKTKILADHVWLSYGNRKEIAIGTRLGVRAKVCSYKDIHGIRKYGLTVISTKRFT